MSVPGLEAHLEEALAKRDDCGRLSVAFSGGSDSEALLLALARIRDRCGSARFALRALHVNHRLHPDAEQWVAHCRAFCKRRLVRLEVLDVAVNERSGLGLEAAAREARYAALAEAIADGETVLTAHTADDQAETVLLRLLRGAGARGLAAMPVARPLGRGLLWRPLLDVRRGRLRDYLAEHGLQGLADPANRDPRFDRSYLRQSVLPALRAHWPGVDGVLLRTAALQAESHELLVDLGLQDLETLREAPGQGLSVEHLRTLDAARPARARNAVRTWLAACGASMPARAQLESALRAGLTPRHDADPRVSLGGLELRRYRGRLFLVEPAPLPADTSIQWSVSTPLHLQSGSLSATRVVGEGVDADRIGGGSLLLRARRGGERCLLESGARTQAVKKLLQARGVPPWIRECMPMLYDGENLVAVADYWVSDGYRARGDKPGWRMRWALRPAVAGWG